MRWVSVSDGLKAAKAGRKKCCEIRRGWDGGVKCMKQAIANKEPESSRQEGFNMTCWVIGRGWDGQVKDVEDLLSCGERAPSWGPRPQHQTNLVVGSF